MFSSKKTAPIPSKVPALPARKSAGKWDASLKCLNHPFARLLLLTVVVSLIKLGAEKTHNGELVVEQLRQKGYSLLMNSLKRPDSSSHPLQIVDVSTMPRVSNDETGNLPAIDRVRLLDMLRRIVKQKPTAIGVDYNFAQERNPKFGIDSDAEPVRYVNQQDEKFFKAVKALQGTTKIYLGVFPRPGTEDFPYYMNRDADTMAAALLVPRPKEHETPGEKKPVEQVASNEETGNKPEETTSSEHSETQHSEAKPFEVSKMPLWIWDPRDGKEPAHQTMASALAQATREEGTRFEPPPTLAWGLDYYFDEKPASALAVRSILVDYSSCNTLESNRIDWKETLKAPESGDSFTDKIVLIGDATRGQTSNPSDYFFVPGDNRPTPGIYLHAAAAKTVLDAPLYALTNQLNILIDLCLGLVAFGVALGIEKGLHQVEHYLKEKKGKAHIHEVFIDFFASLLVAGSAFLLGVGFVSRTRAMWDDVFVVIICTIIHWVLTSIWILVADRRHPHHEAVAHLAIQPIEIKVPAKPELAAANQASPQSASQAKHQAKRKHSAAGHPPKRRPKTRRFKR